MRIKYQIKEKVVNSSVDVSAMLVAELPVWLLFIYHHDPEFFSNTPWVVLIIIGCIMATLGRRFMDVLITILAVVYSVFKGSWLLIKKGFNHVV